MARGLSTLLSSPEPCTAAPGSVTIGHVQLRDVAICPHTRGIVCYPRKTSIVEHNIATPNASPRRLVETPFVPNTLSALILPDTHHTLLAAGGQDAELHLSCYESDPRSAVAGNSSRGFGHRLWEHNRTIQGNASINNSVMLTSMSFSRSHQSAAEPRIVVSNNDQTVKFFDIAIRKENIMDEYEPLLDIGQLHLAVPVNHSSISPDGRTLLCVGDSPDVYLHRVTGGSRVTFSPITTLSLSSYIHHPYEPSGGLSQVSSIPASFSSAFSADGFKFAVASQEGVVVVWDVRSAKPLKVFNTDKSRAGFPARTATGNASGWLYESQWDMSRVGGRAPGWGVRNVKFSPPGVGKEVMTFTEHTSLLHVIDARTFETEEIVRLPTFESPAPYQPTPPSRPRSTSPTLRTSTTRSSTASSSDPLAPPRIVLFSGALEDTFRIPSSDSPSAWRPSRRARRLGRERDDPPPEEDPEGILVIPPLGDREVENDVRRLLGRHGIRRTTVLDPETDPREPLDSPVAAATASEGAREGDEMDVDELESDCVSSHAPSRTGSPAPVAQQSQPQLAGVRPLELLRSRPTLLARRESSGPYAASRWGLSSSAVSSASAVAAARRHRRAAGHRSEDAELEMEQDIAGVCFDPTGTFVYVAGVNGVAEWKVRGAEQRWWTEPQWA